MPIPDTSVDTEPTATGRTRRRRPGWRDRLNRAVGNAAGAIGRAADRRRGGGGG
jgi:hypothetical protein